LGPATARVVLGVEGETHSILEPGNAGALHGGDVNENVAPAIVRRDEAEAFVLVEEFHYPGASHEASPSVFMRKAAGQCKRPHIPACRRAVDKRGCGQHAGTMKSLPLIAAMLFAAAGNAHAAENSAVVTYPAKGNSARAIYEDIKKNAPRVAPNATFAFTAIATKTVKAHKVDGSGCSYRTFNTSVIFNFVVPQHAGTNPLAKSLAKKWGSFVEYLKKHEEGHRDIWRRCIAEYDQTALTLKGADCGALDVQREQMFTALKRRCVAQDEAYDVIFRKQVVNHAFMREALGQPGGARKD